MSNPAVNCGRCANLARGGASPGYGRCGSHARMMETGEVTPLVDLASTCKHAKLSAKYDPDFLPTWRRGLWKMNT